MSHLPLAVTMVKHGKNMSTIEHGKKKLCAISNIYIYIYIYLPLREIDQKWTYVMSYE